MPLPSQDPIGTSVELEQLAVPQLVPTGMDAQRPLPSHVPLLPHGWLELAPQPPCGSALPATTGWQEPALPSRLQTWQLPQLPLEQQTPSTQLPLSHSVPAEQAWPRRLRPQAPALQNLPGAQSPLLAQTATQALPAVLQANGVHDCEVAALQVPLPSQVWASVPATEPLGHDGAAHCVPAV